MERTRKNGQHSLFIVKALFRPYGASDYDNQIIRSKDWLPEGQGPSGNGQLGQWSHTTKSPHPTTCA